jgi:hypothetical protein
MLYTLQLIAGNIAGLWEMATSSVSALLKAYSYFADSLTFTFLLSGFLPSAIASCLLAVSVIAIAKMVVFKV